jgi:hypothetical protein
MQPFVMDGNVVRFKANKIVQFFMEAAQKSGVDLNSLAVEMAHGRFTQDDYEQFSQLHGYSLHCFHELSGVSDLTAKQATVAARQQFGDSEIGGCRDGDCEIHCGVPFVS